jgi:hypothetical protein
MNLGSSTLRNLIYARKARSRRFASWDRLGRNRDALHIKPGETVTLADIDGAGCISHIWMTAYGGAEDPYYLRKVLLRMYWDGEDTPSVEVPLGDFFGVGHAKVSTYVSMPMNMIAGSRREVYNSASMNCYLQMPFSNGARVEVELQSDKELALFFYIDYEELDEVADDVLRLHAQWRRENPTVSDVSIADLYAEHGTSEGVWGVLRDSPNLTGDGNYVILDAEGRGHFVGCNLSFDFLNPIPGIYWFGEGDDMFFIDGEKWPPSLHGTGTEDYFCHAFGWAIGQYDALYHGASLAGILAQGGIKLPQGDFEVLNPPDLANPTSINTVYAGKWTLYRWHIEDPVFFQESIRVTIEHGHNNCHENDFSSVAYWYQTEPHKQFPRMLPMEQRMPIPDKESLKRYFSTI